jgi:hypothetical protein
MNFVMRRRGYALAKKICKEDKGMTREEAIQFLDNMRGNENGRSIGAEGFYAELCGYHVQALNMAIQALSQEPCGDCISRTEAMRAITDEWVRGKHTLEGFTAVLYNLPPVIPEQAESEEQA